MFRSQVSVAPCSLSFSLNSAEKIQIFSSFHLLVVNENRKPTQYSLLMNHQTETILISRWFTSKTAPFCVHFPSKRHKLFPFVQLHLWKWVRFTVWLFMSRVWLQVYRAVAHHHLPQQKAGSCIVKVQALEVLMSLWRPPLWWVKRKSDSDPESGSYIPSSWISCLIQWCLGFTAVAK